MVDAVNQQPQSRGTILPQLLLTTAGAGIGGHYVGRQMNAKDVLKADKFELSGELTTDESIHAASIENNRATLKGGGISAKVEEQATKVFGQADSVPVLEYIEKSQIHSQEVLATQIRELDKDVAKHTQEITAVSEQIAQTSDETAKKALIEKLNGHKSDLNLAQIDLDKAQMHSTLINSAEGGVIKKEAFKASEKARLEGSTVKKIETAFEALKGKIPKKFSWGKAGIGAVAGLVAGIIVARMMAPSTPEA